MATAWLTGRETYDEKHFVIGFLTFLPLFNRKIEFDFVLNNRKKAKKVMTNFPFIGVR